MWRWGIGLSIESLAAGGETAWLLQGRGEEECCGGVGGGSGCSCGGVGEGCVSGCSGCDCGGVGDGCGGRRGVAVVLV